MSPAPGVALCLSGGGYRAMLFHVGVLLRLNEFGWLSRLDRVSSVSGGSITAAMLARGWDSLRFDAAGVASGLDAAFVGPVRRVAARTIDVRAVITGDLVPGRSVTGVLTRAYADAGLGQATLQDLPDRPRFVINATNLQTGALWRFSKPYMADWTIGRSLKPAVALATAVAASSAFPPVLSPLRLPLDPASFAADGRGANFREPYNRQAILTDGGVYDNLGLETAWKRYRTILISDGGGQMQRQPKVHSDWVRQGMRVNAVIDNQVRSLRKRQALAGFLAKERDGAYWSIRSNVADYGPPSGSLPCPHEKTAALAATPTRLEAMEPALQERLINWGYAVCDVAMRRWVVPGAVPPDGFPYRAAGVN